MNKRLVAISGIFIAVLFLWRSNTELEAQTPIRYYARALEVSQTQQIDPRWLSGGGSACTHNYLEIDPLTAKRRTGLRLYVTQDDAPVQDLEGYLIVKRNGAQVWSGRSLNTVNTSWLPTDVCDILREIEGYTLNFEVPYRTMTIGIYEFIAHVVPIGGDPLKAGVPKYSTTSTVLNRKPPRILGVSLNWNPLTPVENHGAPDPGLIDESSGVEDWIWGAFPVMEPTGTKRYSLHPDEFQISSFNGHCNLANQMSEIGLRTSPRPNFVYGFFRGHAMEGILGWVCHTNVSGYGGVGHTTVDQYEKSFAHEFGHKIGGLYHTFDIGLGSDSIDEVGLDVFRVAAGGMPRPKTLDPILGMAGPTIASWAHLESVRQFMITSGTTLRPGYPMPENEPDPVSSTIVWLEEDGSGNWDFNRALEVHGAVNAIEPYTDTMAPGRLRVLDAVGGELFATDIVTPTAVAMDGVPISINSTMVEYPLLSGVEQLELSWGGSVASVMTRTANAPIVSITSPVVSATLGVTETVQWTASDLDGDSLTAYIEYSHDGGDTIIPLTNAITNTNQVEIKTMNLPASNNGSITIRVSDGLNTSVSTVSGLVLGPDKAPFAKIQSPRDLSVYRASVLPIFSAVVHDPEDRELPDSSITWTSNIDGFLGNGEMLETVLSLGTHVITLKATDSASNISQDSVTITMQ